MDILVVVDPQKSMFSVLVTLVLVSAVAAGPPTQIRFLNDSKASAVTVAGQPLVGLQEEPIFPGVILQVVDDNGTPTSAPQLKVYASSQCVILAGKTVDVINGFANFTSLTAKSCGTPCPILFTVGGDGGYPVIGQRVSSGDFTVTALPNFDIRFTRQSFIQNQQGAIVTANKSMHHVLVQLVNSCYNDDTTNTGATVTVTSSPSGRLSGAQATFTNGRALFMNLLYVDVPTTPSQLTFRVDQLAGIPAAGKYLLSGNMTVLGVLLNNFNIAFKRTNSAFTWPGEAADIAIGATFSYPIFINMLDSSGATDASNNDVVITMTGATGVSGPTQVTMVNGVAAFNGISFSGCQTGGAVSLTFTAGDQGSTPAAGKSLVTGKVIVRGQRNTLIDFGSSSQDGSVGFYSAAGQAKTVMVGVVIPTIILWIQDSCKNVDESGTGLFVTASSTEEDSFLSGKVTVPVVNGVASFENLMFPSTSTGSPRLTFTAVGPAVAYPVVGKTAVTGPVTLQRPAGATAPPSKSHSKVAIFDRIVITIGVLIVLAVCVYGIRKWQSRKGETKENLVVEMGVGNTVSVVPNTPTFGEYVNQEMS